MATLTEDYVSYETAKLLKERGFDIPVRTYYENDDYEIVIDNEIIFGSTRSWNNNCSTGYISAPTQAMAMKWLREACGLIISIEYQGHCPTWKWIIHIKSSDKKHTNFQHYDKYEETCEVAIKYALKYLI